MSLPVSAIYVVALAAIGLVLQYHVGMVRRKERILLGDGGNAEMLQAMRRHANFVENVPLALILLIVVEATGAGATTIHALGITLLVARIVHPFGINARRMTAARGLGAGLTVLMMVGAIVVIVRQLRFS